MGADLYIEPQCSEAREKAEPAFEAACKARDLYMKENPGSDRRTKDDLWKFEDPKLQELQDAVEKASDEMYPDEWYFRDSYNATSVLNHLGLSWWKDVGELEDAVDRKREETDEDYDPKTTHSPAACLKLVEMIEARELPKPEDLELTNATIDDGENSREKWHEMFVEKRARLIAFLRRAAEHGGCYMSL